MNISNDTSERTRLLLGDKGVLALNNATVLVAGCGAVGGFALEALARAGIGHLIIVDFDTVAPSNLNRQIFATTKTIGQPKIQVAEKRLKEINPQIKITALPLMIQEQTVEQLFDIYPDFAIDAIDSLNPKTLLLEQLVKRQIPFISAMGAALKTDISRIHIAPIKKTIQCPLAAFVRKRLRKRGVPLDFKVVFSDECVADKAHLGPKEADEPNKRGRHTMGSLVTVTGLFGLMCAHEAILHLTRKDA